MKDKVRQDAVSLASTYLERRFSSFAQFLINVPSPPWNSICIRGKHTDLTIANSSGQSTPTPSSITCTKSQISFGAFILDDEEANELTRDLIHTNLKTLNALLKGLLYNTGQENSMSKTSNVREVDDLIRPITSRLLRVLGRTRCSAWEHA